MHRSVWLLRLYAFLALATASVCSASVNAQGITTAAIVGHVQSEGQPTLAGAQAEVVNSATGHRVTTVVRDGRFSVGGLDMGGPYSVVVRKVGYRPAYRRGIMLTLGQEVRLEFSLVRLDALDTVRVVSGPPSVRTSALGIGMTISDSALRRLPTIDRDFYDFVRLTPEVSARSARTGMSGGGVSTRFNSFLIDGVSDRGLIGNFAAATGQGAKAISIEAIKEYQILLSPFDVRYGDFAGALVNAVTRSGTNELHGTVFGFARDDRLARSTEFLRSSSYQRQQYGISTGGPLIRDRAHFFFAAERQHLLTPAKGPYLTGGAQDPALPVSAADLTRFADVMRGFGLNPGTPTRVTLGNPLANFFGKIDLDLNELNSRIVVWHNYGAADNSTFSRDVSTSFFTRGATTFPLSSVGATSTARKRVTAAQAYTNLPRGGINEFSLAIKSQPNEAIPVERAPLVSVAVPRANAAGTAFLESGSSEPAQGVGTEQNSFEIADNITFALGGSNSVAVGVRLESFRIKGHGQPGGYGSWLFSSLDSLERGEADRYRIVKRIGPLTPRGRTQYSLYLSDRMSVTRRFSIVAGLRADALSGRGSPAYNPAVDSLYHRNTSDVGRTRIELSPRTGFDWDVTGDGRSHIRSGVGVFVGRPPASWLDEPFRNAGGGVGTLLCGARRVGDLGLAPAFVPDYDRQPTSCANGRGLSTQAGGAVDLVDLGHRLAKTMRTSLSYDRRLFGNVVATLEGLYTHNVQDFAYVNLNLLDASGSSSVHSTDRHGRVLYGNVDPAGRALPRTVSTRFSEVIDLRNQSRNYSYQLAARLEKHFSGRSEWSAAYAFSRTRDVQTPPSSFSANENWQSGRVLSGSHQDLSPTISGLDVPHRFVLSASYSIPWRRLSTDVSLYYVGESGTPFTYLASAGQGTGDLNADGTNLNDPLYLPLSARDTSEILFSGSPEQVTSQQAAFDALLERRACLRRQRGRIMQRNSCRSPWVHITNASIRQSLPAIGGHTLTMQIDVYNVLNLLNSRWGKVRTTPSSGNVALLEQVGQTSGPSSTSQPIFRFDPSSARFTSENAESAFQLQLGVRYTF